ncbi:MAG: imidazole glycerol phosphate synthase subunit HisH [Kangiellaceae bacterium]
MSVDILDVGSGNIQSIKNWIEKANISTRVLNKASDIKSTLLILPGVGSAGSYMKRLKLGRFDEAIFEHVDKGGRILGICLGFQIMSAYSEEDGGVEGLNFIDGYVERLQGNASHNSWEPIYVRRDELEGQSFNRQMNLSKKRILDGRVFYNHEYGFVNKEENSFSIPVSDALPKYSGLLVKDKIIGMQFHPEKSQITGLELVSMIL